ncbi:MAG: hypothetical protein QOH28_2413, partial [Actinomycetota bacterium]|nr:hypothetical protein [Actinomycetota bacterium]
TGRLMTDEEFGRYIAGRDHYSALQSTMA